MKKLLLILFIAFIALQSFSQENDFKPYSSFGIKQGINYSSVLFVPSVKQGIQLGYLGGLVYKYQNERLFGLQVELNYIQKGWTEEFDESNYSYSRRISYIELPFITHVVLGKRKLRYYVNLGTAFGYYLSESEKIKVSDEDLKKEFYEKKVENYFDYSGLGEVGFVIHSGIGEFQTGFRYQLTLLDIFKTTDETFYYQSYNSVFAFSITYFLFDNK